VKTCSAPNCNGETFGGKPYCPAHVLLMPLARKVHDEAPAPKPGRPRKVPAPVDPPPPPPEPTASDVPWSVLRPRRRYMTLTCQACGVQFTSHDRRRRYCGATCKRAVHAVNAMNREAARIRRARQRRAS
jgi:hypothetical protein